MSKTNDHENTTETVNQNVLAAAIMFISRRDRESRPDGRTEGGGRWYPSEAESCDCCRFIRAPSYAWPLSLLTHCCTAEHVANLNGVDVSELRKVARKLDKEAKLAA